MKVSQLIAGIALLVTIALPFASLAAQPARVYFVGVDRVSTDKDAEITFLAASPQQAMNAIEGSILYDVSQIDIVAVRPESSIVSFWIKDPTSNIGGGVIQFAGVVVNPGYTGSTGKLFSIIYRPKIVGTTIFAPTDIKLLSNDGLGTEMQVGVDRGVVEMIKPFETEPELEKVIEPTPALDNTDGGSSQGGSVIINHSATVFKVEELLAILGDQLLPSESAIQLSEKIPKDVLLRAPSVSEMIANKDRSIKTYQAECAVATTANIVSVAVAVTSWMRVAQLRRVLGSVRSAANLFR